MNPVRYITTQIRYMCRSFRGRSGGSRAEAQCQEYIRRELAGYADEVTTQEFTVHPDVGWAWIVIVSLACLLSILLPLINVRSVLLAAVALAASVLAVCVTVFQFLFGFHMIDRFFPKKTARNVFASVKPAGKTARRVVFTGHADAAYEMTHSHRGGAQNVLRVAATSVASLALIFLLNAAAFLRIVIAGSLLPGSAWHWLRIGGVALIPFLIEALFFFNTRCIVDGANDNLSGCAVAMAALKALSGHGKRLAHTEVCCLITSSEECGLRGAHAFARQYAKEADGVDTAFIVLDTLADIEHLQVYAQGMNGLQKNNAEVATLIQEAGQSLGLHLPQADAFLGATDAEAFSRAGLKACAICGVDHVPQPYYHTREDHAGNIDEACLDASLRLCLEVAERMDRQEAAAIALPAAG